MYFDLSSMIASAGVSIGGGKGYWCTNQYCNKRYRTQPSKGTICGNQYTRTSLNKEKLASLIHEMGEVDESVVQKYIEHPDEKIPEIDQILEDENQHVYDGTIYDTLMELIDSVYEDQVYDCVTETCKNTEFVYEERKGTTINQISGDYLSMYNQLLNS